MINKATIVISGKKHTVEMINGERFVDGKPIDEFVDSLSPLELVEMCKVGMQAIRDEIKGTQPRSYQKMADDYFLMRS